MTTPRQRAADTLAQHYDGDRGPDIGGSVIAVLHRAGLTIVEHDWTAAAVRELRSLLEEFHTERGPSGGHIAIARTTPGDIAQRLNRLAALERGEVPQ